MIHASTKTMNAPPPPLDLFVCALCLFQRLGSYRDSEYPLVFVYTASNLQAGDMSFQHVILIIMRTRVRPIFMQA